MTDGGVVVGMLALGGQVGYRQADGLVEIWIDGWMDGWMYRRI